MGSLELREFLRRKGYGLDVEVPEKLFETSLTDLEETSRTTVTRIYPEAESYRDSRRFSSIHVTDYRGVEREDQESDVIVAHLEFFNPEKHPVLHTLIDTPVWFVKNRLLRKSDL
jgi:hypothetical protein